MTRNGACLSTIAVRCGKRWSSTDSRRAFSWRTLLAKREAFRAAFKGFDPEVVAGFDERDVERLMADKGIVRSHAKVRAAIGNARAYLTMRNAGEDFGTVVWGLAGGRPIEGGRHVHVSKTPTSEQIANDLKKRGFKFVGAVIVHAWVQAVGIINDHEPACFRHNGVKFGDTARIIIET